MKLTERSQLLPAARCLLPANFMERTQFHSRRGDIVLKVAIRQWRLFIHIAQFVRPLCLGQVRTGTMRLGWVSAGLVQSVGRH